MNLLRHLGKKAKLSDSLLITYDELAEWPAKEIEEAKQQGCLVQTNDADGLICPQCPEHCWKDVEIRQKDGRNVGVFFCEDGDCAGLVKIELERLQQWKINKKKLSHLGYGKKRKGIGGQKREEKQQNDILLMRAALLKHHGFEGDTFSYQPAAQKELQALTRWGQSKVHRVMKAIFGDSPMSTYKQQCRTKAITGFLKRNDDGSYTVEAVHDPINQ